MQIVINIDEEDYKVICDEAHHSVGYDTPVDNAMVAIANGKPLSKEHGRLIDADEIQFENAEFDTYGDYCRAFDAIDQAETVLEADKEI